MRENECCAVPICDPVPVSEAMTLLWRGGASQAQRPTAVSQQPAVPLPRFDPITTTRRHTLTMFKAAVNPYDDIVGEAAPVLLSV